ncbi:hypothetical protein BN77_3528 [Rhizobium mesoamericanum STM3625]|uniref:Uncharacterized protein n=1 Tax=Rhizobium mesoamericanum STM3625 TaxID=1211777 RepID=K0PXR0_9HYPH|nr:hypothetical protein BN77_3528 [Rhizobium mesoamericanum STM3625]
MFRSHAILPALICDRLSTDEQREFPHGEYIGVSHNWESGREFHRHWPDEVEAQIVLGES